MLLLWSWADAETELLFTRERSSRATVSRSWSRVWRWDCRLPL